MATSSFFYGGSTAPEQNTVDALIDDLNEKVSQASQDRAAAEGAALSAQSSANSAAASADNASVLVAQATEIISHFTISTENPSGGVEGDVWFKIN